MIELNEKCLKRISIAYPLNGGADKPVRYFDEIQGKVEQNGQSLESAGEIFINNYQHS